MLVDANHGALEMMERPIELALDRVVSDWRVEGWAVLDPLGVMQQLGAVVRTGEGS